MLHYLIQLVDVFKHFIQWIGKTETAQVALVSAIAAFVFATVNQLWGHFLGQKARKKAGIRQGNGLLAATLGELLNNVHILEDLVGQCSGPLRVEESPELNDDAALVLRLWVDSHQIYDVQWQRFSSNEASAEYFLNQLAILPRFYENAHSLMAWITSLARSSCPIPHVTLTEIVKRSLLVCKNILSIAVTLYNENKQIRTSVFLLPLIEASALLDVYNVRLDIQWNDAFNKPARKLLLKYGRHLVKKTPSFVPQYQAAMRVLQLPEPKKVKWWLFWRK